VQEVPIGNSDDEPNQLIRAAAELKGQRLAMPDLVINALSDKMTYEDLPDDVKAKVSAVKETTSPKHPSQLAADLLEPISHSEDRVNGVEAEPSKQGVRCSRVGSQRISVGRSW
jgi:hypothetical protein